jgi:hypothetical protein
MKNSINIKNLLQYMSLALLLLLQISCDKSDDISDVTKPSTSYEQGATVDRNFHGVILDLSGNPINGATVSIGTSTAQTNSRGIFSISSASVREKFAYIKVSKTGFIDGSRVIVPTTGDNRINIMLIPNSPTATVASGVSSEVNLPNGTKVKFDGSFKDASGNAYSGNVTVSLYHLKTSNPYLSEIMPGSLLATNTAGETKMLETFGMIHVDLKGSGGQKLNLASGHTAEISIEIDATQTSTAPATIPLWSFDEATGIWKEEASATKIANKYVGNVSHFSWWNPDYPYGQCNLSVTVNNTAGSPISNLLLGLARPGQAPIYRSTNLSGQVNGAVFANEILTLTIKNLCGTIIYTTPVGPFAVASNNVLPTIVLSNTAVPTVTINGTLKTCANANVTNGLVMLKNTSLSSNYYNQIMQPVTNGTFSFVTNICGSSQQFEFKGEDYTNLQSSGPILFTATAPVTNIGNILTCTSNNEFITYQVDSDPTRYVISNISNQSSGGSLYISNNNTGGSFPFFYLSMQTGFTGVATYNTGFGMEFTLGTALTGFSNISTVQLIVSQYGPVGGYIDFTFNGTYSNSTGNHTVTGTGHVIRD